MTRDRAAAEATLAHPHGRSVLPPNPAAAGPPEAVMAGKAAAENFPVALRMLPRRHRDHLMAVYSYARTVDDIGDEGAPEQRLALLADLAEDLRRLYAQPGGDAARPRHPAVRGLASVVTDCAIPMQPFLDLIGANQQDQLVSRYATFDELLGYCRLSANPVGRIVLDVFGCSTPERVQLSDYICTGLQIVEHLQDVAEDFQAGRVYLPAEDLRSYDCTEEDLAGSTAPPQLRRLISFEAARAGSLISQGAPLVGQLRGAARAAVAGYLAGGRAALAAIAAADYDVLAATPRPAKSRTLRELASAML
ncbi:MAG TPA: squalene synthase HpnC, partial [Streptosporangiaceae bacterium]|nr:squalene synthase HpnC [Streptosporangiaceae bacterium]